MARTMQPTVWLSKDEAASAKQTKFPENLISSTDMMAVMVTKALCFILSTLPALPPSSAGPRRSSTRRTETLQKELTTKDKTRLQKNRATIKLRVMRIFKATTPAHISQTQPMQMFLIVMPPSLLRLM